MTFSAPPFQYAILRFKHSNFQSKHAVLRRHLGTNHYFTIDFQLICPPLKSLIPEQFLPVTYSCQQEDFQGYGIIPV